MLPKNADRGSNPRGRPTGSNPVAANSMSKFWCFTINNPINDFEEVDNVVNWDYMIVAHEVGEDGTPHLQGFVAYKNRTRFSTVKGQMPRAHIERMMGTPKQASDYCKKDGAFFEAGTLPDFEGGRTGGQKKRENFNNMIEAAKKGTMDEIQEIDPVSYVQHYHAFKRIIQDNPPPVQDLETVCGEWLWGEPGVGKSHRARAENPNHYDKPLNKWWDGYKGQDVIILDDVGLGQGSWIGDLLKRWADKFSFPAEQKGTTVSIRPKKIIVTSNYKIEEIFQDVSLCKAIQRRFKEIQVEQWVPEAPVYAEDTDDEYDVVEIQSDD